MRTWSLPVAVITGVVAASILLVGHLPRVPLDDSWNFVLPLKHFLETGVPVFDSFNSAAAVIHLVVAAPFALLFGPGFPQTVAVNLLITWLCAICVYALCRQAGASRGMALVASLSFWAAPPVFVTAFTFQSDPVFVLLMTLSLLGFSRYLVLGRRWALLGGSLAAALSLWGKYHGILIAPAVCALLVAKRDLREKTPAEDYALILAPSLVSYLAFRLASPLIHPVTTTLDRKFVEFTHRLFSPEIWMREGLFRLLMAGVLLCFFLLPLILAGVCRKGEETEGSPRWRGPLIAVVPALIATVAVVLGSWALGRPRPLISSVLTEPPSMEPMGVYAWLYFGSLFALPLWVFLASRRRSGGGKVRDNLIALGAFVLAPQAALLVPVQLYMDRYFLVLLPPLILMTVAMTRGLVARWWFALPVLVVFLILDTQRVVGYRNGCEAQWLAADNLVTRGVPAEAVDGGYAWVGWNNFERCRELPERGERIADLSPWVLELCPRMRPEWFVTFHPPDPRERKEIVDTHLYQAGWFLEERPIYVLKKRVDKRPRALY